MIAPKQSAAGGVRHAMSPETFCGVAWGALNHA